MMNRDDGFGIMEVIIAIGLMAVLSLGLMRLMDNSYKSSADLNVRQEIRDLRDEFYTAIKSSGCGLSGPNEDVKDKNYKIDITKSTGLNLQRLYGRYGQSFKAEERYGKVTIAKDSPFKLGPLSRNSPLIEGLPANAKTPGGYYLMDTKVAAELSIQLTSNNKARPSLKFMALLTLDASDIITDCTSIAELTSAKESCTTMQESDGKLMFEWNDLTSKCDVTMAETPDSSDGRYNLNEPGDVDPKLYILSKIPGNN